MGKNELLSILYYLIFHSIEDAFFLANINIYVNVEFMTWEILYYSEALQKKIANLPAGIQARYIHLIERMSLYGANLGMPHTKALKEGLFELRMKSKEGIGRVFYCTLLGRRIVMLHTFIKKSQKIPAKELTIAISRMNEVKKNDDT